MITAEELEKLNELKEKGIITEEEFNLKREEFLNDTADVSETSSSGFSLWGILVVLSGLLTFCSIISGGNSDKICGKYNTFYGGAFSGGWITTFDGFTIYIEFPNEYINKEWSKYDKQNICISGNAVRTPQQGNQPNINEMPNYYLASMYLAELKERNSQLPKLKMQMSRFEDDF